MTSQESSLSQLIGRIYDAALAPALWPSMLEQSCSFVGGYAANILWHDVATERSAVFHEFNVDPHYHRLYMEKYAAMNPLFPASTFLEPGLTYSIGDIVPMPEFVETDFYKEWVAPQGIVDALGTNLDRTLTSSALFVVLRSVQQGLVDDEMRRRMLLIVPHVRRAAAIGQLIGEHTARMEALADTLGKLATGVFMVDADGRIGYANAAGQAMLDQGSVVRARQRTLAAVDPDAERELRDVIAAAGRGDNDIGIRGVAVPLGGSQQERWLAHVLSLTSGARRQAATSYSAAAAVFVRKITLALPSPLEVLAKLYPLTASELRVLQAVVEVGGVPAVAEALGISRATVRTHLHHVFQKTATKRQSELVKLVAGSATPFAE
jgi:DNA-binding CsgD family transcriptional regulator/PAS domain-containing protein